MFWDPSGLIKVVDGKSQNTYKLGAGNIELNTYEAKDIEKMQKKLQTLGYLDGSFNNYGYFDLSTENAVNNFKKDNNLKNDTINTKGIVGATTWQKLGLDFDLYSKDNEYLATARFNENSIQVDAFKGEIYTSSFSVDIADKAAQGIKKTYSCYLIKNYT